MNKERPILFNGKMVQSILDGRKTQTRRVIKPQPVSNPFPLQRCPYGVPIDLLWVQETWVKWDAGIAYLADCLNRHGVESEDSKRCRLDYGVIWKPSIHMPRWASRITLRVTDVRVERVQEISEADAQAEGVSAWHDTNNGTVYRPEFRTLWDSINAARGFGWDANPWVWVVEFERVQP